MQTGMSHLEWSLELFIIARCWWYLLSWRLIRLLLVVCLRLSLERQWHRRRGRLLWLMRWMRRVGQHPTGAEVPQWPRQSQGAGRSVSQSRQSRLARVSVCDRAVCLCVKHYTQCRPWVTCNNVWITIETAAATAAVAASPALQRHLQCVRAWKGGATAAGAWPSFMDGSSVSAHGSGADDTSINGGWCLTAEKRLTELDFDS